MIAFQSVVRTVYLKAVCWLWDCSQMQYIDSRILLYTYLPSCWRDFNADDLKIICNMKSSSNMNLSCCQLSSLLTISFNGHTRLFFSYFTFTNSVWSFLSKHMCHLHTVLYLSDRKLQFVEEVPYITLIFDFQLNWWSHVHQFVIIIWMWTLNYLCHST